jgi:hypothetical protein
MPVGRIVSYDEARRLARSYQWREKVLVYVTRGDDLLVLEHTAESTPASPQQRRRPGNCSKRPA